MIAVVVICLTVALTVTSCVVGASAPIKSDPSTKQTAAFSYSNGKMQYAEPIIARAPGSASITDLYDCKRAAGNIFISKAAARAYCACKTYNAEYMRSVSKRLLCKLLGHVIQNVAEFSSPKKAKLTEDPQTDPESTIYSTNPWVDQLDFACAHISWNRSLKQVSLSTTCADSGFWADTAWARKQDDWAAKWVTPPTVFQLHRFFFGGTFTIDFKASLATADSKQPEAVKVSASKCTGSATAEECMIERKLFDTDKAASEDFKTKTAECKAADNIWLALGNNANPVAAFGRNACRVLEVAVEEAMRQMAKGGEKLWGADTGAVVMNFSELLH